MAGSIWFTAARTATSAGSISRPSNRTPIDGQPAPTYGPPPLRRRPLLSSSFLEQIHVAHRSRRAQRHHSGAQGQQQEADSAGADRQGGRTLGPERADHPRNLAAARKAWFNRCRERHRHSTWQAAKAEQAVRIIRTTRKAV